MPLSRDHWYDASMAQLFESLRSSVTSIARYLCTGSSNEAARNAADAAIGVLLFGFVSVYSTLDVPGRLKSYATIGKFATSSSTRPRFR